MAATWVASIARPSTRMNVLIDTPLVSVKPQTRVFDGWVIQHPDGNQCYNNAEACKYQGYSKPCWEVKLVIGFFGAFHF
jgi:hypothetical protein